MKPILAKNYEGQPVAGWLMSEKLDGVRALWTGEKLISRNGNEFFPPQLFIDGLPAGIPLDGELFIARRLFQATVSAVKKKTPAEEEWRRIRFCVFDAPAAPGGFEERLAYCKEILHGSPVAEVVNHRFKPRIPPVNALRYTPGLLATLPLRHTAGRDCVRWLVVLLRRCGQNAEPVWTLPIRRFSAAILPVVGGSALAPKPLLDLRGGVICKLFSEGHGQILARKK